MQCHITITNFPKGVALSYPPTDFGKYGWIRFLYNFPSGTFKGPIHWVNSRTACFEPEYRCPVFVEGWFDPSVQGFMSFQAGTFADVPGATINGTQMNPATGAGLPPAGVL
jgi:hypothetical protein